MRHFGVVGFCFGSALVGAANTTLLSQELDSTRIRVLQAAANSSVRLSLMDGTRVEGRLERVGPAIFYLRGSPVGIITPSAVDTVWRKRRFGKLGAEIGAGLGLAAGTLYSYSYFSNCSREDPCKDEAIIPLILAYSGISGAAYGFVIGVIFSRWERRFP
ncbi:MAG TPA: hypothetical protein VM166_12165 [Gemmatimonadaceae bacterium]|nr:hypothetical protein [Gemmatimonadaceae bacterium]